MTRLTRLIEQIVRDSRLAFRTFARFPLFTATAVLTVGLGMGFNTSLFSVMHAVLFRPLPVAEPETLRNLFVGIEGGQGRMTFSAPGGLSFQELAAIRSASTTADLAGVAAVQLSWQKTEVRSLEAQLVSDNLLPMLGARPVLGRFFTADETVHPGGAPVVVLSHRFWAVELGGDPSVVGTMLTLNRTPFTVIGVADQKTRGPMMLGADLWIPLTMQRLTRPGESLIDMANAAWIQIFARARGGATDGQVAAEMQLLAERTVEAGTGARIAASVVPASFLSVPKARRMAVPGMALLWVAFGLILVVACANVANMLMARGLARQKEFAIRRAVGADRQGIVRLLLTESAWLGLLGGVLGLGLAFGAGRLADIVIPASIDLQFDFSPDPAVLGFAAVMSLVSGLAFGFLPALHSTGFELSPSLKGDGGGSAGRPRLRVQHLLVAVQVAACVVLLVNAGLVVRSLRHALTMDVGKPLDRLVIGSFDLRQQQYDSVAAESFFDRLTERVRSEPGMVAVSTSFLQPELSSASNVIRVDDGAEVAGESFQVAFDEVGAEYFAAAGISVLAGRSFTEAEVRRGDAVMLVDQRFADERLQGRAIGRRIDIGAPRGGAQVYEVIGVVNSTHPLGAGRRVLPTYYVPIRGLRYMEATIQVRHRGDHQAAIAAIRRAAAEIDPNLLVKTSTIEQNVEQALLPVRIVSYTLTALGALALVLATVGLFGVIAFAVGRRAREIAIRVALGAAPGRVLGLVVRQGVGPIVGGGVVGLALAVAGGFLIRRILYGLSPVDPITLGAVIVLVVVAAVTAFWIPARRAIAVQPASVLRED